MATDVNGAVPTTALVNEVLQSLAYYNTSNTPDPTATITVTFDDGGGNAVPLATTITLTDVPNGDGVIGDYVWNDVNRNGVQDGNEQGLGGVQFVLYYDSDTTTPIAFATSDQAGHYEFDALFAGDYRVGVNDATIPSGYVDHAHQGGPATAARSIRRVHSSSPPSPPTPRSSTSSTSASTTATTRRRRPTMRRSTSRRTSSSSAT